MNNNEKEGFSYIYSAKQQEEIKKIRNKYAAPEEDKLTQLRRLDEGVSRKASTVAIIVGIVGALIMGAGMSFAMTNIGSILGSFDHLAMPLGIVIGIAGMIILALAYPLYQRIIKKERERIAPEIIRLTDELLK